MSKDRSTMKEKTNTVISKKLIWHNRKGPPEGGPFYNQNRVALSGFPMENRLSPLFPKLLSDFGHSLHVRLGLIEFKQKRAPIGRPFSSDYSLERIIQ